MKLDFSQPRHGHAHRALLATAGRTLAAGLAFTAMAPAAHGIFTASAQAQKSYYNPKTDPFEATQEMKDRATLIMSSAPDLKGRMGALFDMLSTSSPVGLKASSGIGRAPRTAKQTLQKSGDCTDLAGVIIAVINSMNAQGAGIEADAVVVHFRSSPPDEKHMVARVHISGMPLIIDPQAGSIGATKAGSYDVALTLTLEQAAGMYHRKYGDYLRDNGMAAEAVKAYERSLEIFGGDAYVHKNLGILYEKAGRMGEAARQFATADSIAPGTSRSGDAKRGSYNQELKAAVDAYNSDDYCGCERHYRNALEIDPKPAHADSATINAYIDDCARRQQK